MLSTNQLESARVPTCQDTSETRGPFDRKIDMCLGGRVSRGLEPFICMLYDLVFHFPVHWLFFLMYSVTEPALWIDPYITFW